MIKLRDIIIIICLLGAAAGIYIYNDKGEGSRVQIDYDGYKYAEIEFMAFADDEEQRIHINGTTVVIDKYGAYFAHSDCKDKICVRSGKINRVGQTVVCLPLRVSIRIEGEKAEFDGITG
ncbi:MAG: hypothetical protein CVU97_00140 [Firmicutes bacterium HGW-Firmicutes-21]|nr:MAG: hypothetical protein CVU97_00140 [Firmicutes bacterium HGW-Firmicutes-21]